ncbi:MAG: glycosyltransferase family 2 protein [Desulfovibrio sp.]|jgi:glycosyltransferase involved in cell wall biosynthesis|nr:glycosyltransferase family 2 protein [Desulfovibrio sp.]
MYAACAVKYSLAVPCYNEGAGLPGLLRRLKALSVEREDVEIILVDNGSSDATVRLVQNAPDDNRAIVPVRVERNQGYGYGVLQGLRAARGEFLGWTHADMQTDPADALRALRILERESTPERVYLKGARYARPFADRFFTVGMSALESLLFLCPLWDINAQPNIFHRSFYERWSNPPHDFSLDLYAYATAAGFGLKIMRFPVLFSDREHGLSHWNVNLRARMKFIRRTLEFSVRLRREWNACKS